MQVAREHLFDMCKLNAQYPMCKPNGRSTVRVGLQRPSGGEVRPNRCVRGQGLEDLFSEYWSQGDWTDDVGVSEG